MLRKRIRLGVDVLEDRTTLGKVLDLTALPIELLSFCSSNDKPDQFMTELASESATSLAKEVEQPTWLSSLIQTDESRASSSAATSPVSLTPSESISNYFGESLTLQFGLGESFQGAEPVGIKPVAPVTFNEPVAFVVPPLSQNAFDARMTETMSQTIISLTDDTASSNPLDEEEGGKYTLMDTEPGDPGENVTTPGNIGILCETTPGQLLPEESKLSPGWLSNVNWSDDDGDGWRTLYGPESTITEYIPDRDDTSVPGGDRDLRKFEVQVNGNDTSQDYDHSFTLTFGSNVAVYLSNTKAGGRLESPYIVDTEQMTFRSGFGAEYKTFWLEGQEASTAFRDGSLVAEYTPDCLHNTTKRVISPMLKTSDEVKVTVLGVTNTGIYSGGQQEDNDARFSDTINVSTRCSYDEDGQMSWDLPQYMNAPPAGYGASWCKYFHDCIEIQGTVSPPRDDNPSQYYGWTDDGWTEGGCIPRPDPLPASLVNFSYSQKVIGITWEKFDSEAFWKVSGPRSGEPGEGPGGSPGQWVPDDPISGAQSVVPSLTDHIYMI
ncbi:MAG: hypothetical protein QM703_16110 [Gemmatales bacterium]